MDDSSIKNKYSREKAALRLLFLFKNLEEIN